MSGRFLSRFGLWCAIGLVGLSVSMGAQPALTPTPSPRAGESLTVVISDLHFGLGRENGAWNPLDDFRWSGALAGFLARIGELSDSNTTLVIAGDFLEMWQHPDIACSGADADHGCSVDEMERVARAIVRGHQADLKALGDFARRGNNQLVIVPGNHDAALMIPTVRQIVVTALGTPAGSIRVEQAGEWVSSDGAIVVEHGHQMRGESVNSYPHWPMVLEPIQGRADIMWRPWGEYFVHNFFDDVEQRYEIVDNMIPQTRGAHLYSRDVGLWGTARDVARLLVFNLLQVSATQRGSLGANTERLPLAWDVPASRQKGWKVIADAEPNPWYRPMLEDPPTPEWGAIRGEMDQAIRDEKLLPDDEVRLLCDRGLKLKPPGSCVRKDATAGSDILYGLQRNAHRRAIAAELARLKKKNKKMQVFVFGHTHALECTKNIEPDGGFPLQVANDGAFQRLVDEKRFTADADCGEGKPRKCEEALRTTKPESLPACYSSVQIRYVDGVPKAVVKNWYMEETEGAVGEFVDPWDIRCAALGPLSTKEECQKP